VATFGDASSSPARPIAVPSMGGAPRTPTKTPAPAAGAAAAALAYAGPNFHNSPSPASLPKPTFGARSAAARSALGAASSGDEAPQRARTPGSPSRARRERAGDEAAAPVAAAPEQAQASAPHPQAPLPSAERKAQTIEELMARMLAPPPRASS
jgi:hypothetical protein